MPRPKTRPRKLSKTESEIIAILSQHDGSTDIATILASVSKRYTAVSIQQLLTRLSQRGLIMRSGVTVVLLE